MNNTISNLVRLALEEDVAAGDVTAELIDPSKKMDALVTTREKMVLCGREYFDEVFKQVNIDVDIVWQYKDGDVVVAGDELCKIAGNARSILTAERTALNFLQTLSGTATYTHEFTQLIKHTNAKLLDTRKTIPGLRLAQKYAVKCGGGVNHRMGLYDAFLIKENHIQAAGSITQAVGQARKLNPSILLEVEVENFSDFDEALQNKVPRIMLDNFDLEMLSKAVNNNRGQAALEASGNVSEETVVAIAETGVDYISCGKLTKDVRAIDLSMRAI